MSYRLSTFVAVMAMGTPVLIMGAPAYADLAIPATNSPQHHVRCRVPNAPVDANSSSLPVCRANPAAPQPQPSRAPSSPAPAIRAPIQPKAASVTFAEYLNANARNPALNMKIAGHQRAFVESRPVAVFTPQQQGTLEREDSAQAAPPAQQAQAAPIPAIPMPSGIGSQ